MRDSEVAASIVAGDPGGLAAAYDRYADPLYKYCRSMLSDPADAADAVQDTFVIAASRLARLRDPDRLRAWLYAVARNECLRVPRFAASPSALNEVPGAPEVTADAAGPADLRALFEDAAGRLDPAEREVIELSLWHGLEPAEVAAVLGVSLHHAQSLLSRARDQVAACLGASPELSPGSAMAAAVAESPWRMAGAPASLRGHTLTLVAGQGPAAAAHRAAVLSRASAFTWSGFPRVGPWEAARGSAGSGHRGRPGWAKGILRTPRGQATTAAAVVLAVILAMTVFALAGNTGQFTPTAAAKPQGASPPPLSPVASALASAPTAAAPGPAPASAQPSPTPTRATPSQSATPPPASLTQSPPGGTQANPVSLVVMPSGQGTAISLSARDGASDWAVNWSVTVANDPGHVISVSPASSGILTPASPNAKVTITVSQSIRCGHRGEPACPAITISPGGAVYTIWTSWKHPLTGNGTLAPPAQAAARRRLVA